MHVTPLSNRNGALISSHGCFLSREDLFKELLINLIKRADARRGQAKKRSLHGVNEYFEPGRNAADAASAN
jgi:hypothetical protein